MTEPTDFRTPFVAVAIRNGRGAILPLWQLDEGSDAKRDFPTNSAFPWVQQVTVENQLGNVPIITCSLTPPFREGLEFLDSSFIEYGNSELQVQLGYSNPKIAPRVFTGILLEPAVTIGEDIQIGLNAHGTGGFAAHRNESGRTNKEGETRIELMRRIAAGNGGKSGMTIDDSDTKLSLPTVAGVLGNASDADIAKEGDTLKLLEAPVTYSQGNKTDWAALWELANGANAWINVISQAERPGEETRPVLKITPRSHSMAQPPKRILRLYDLNEGRLGAASNPSLVPASAAGSVPTEYPILGLSNPPSAIYLPAEQRGVFMAEVSDKDPTEVNEELLNEENTKQTRSTDGKTGNEDSASNPTFDKASKEGGARIPGDPQLSAAVQAAVMEYRRAGNMGIQLEIETIGIPDMEAGETILLAGIGRRFGTPRWLVHKYVHSIGSGGFTTSLTVIGNMDGTLSIGLDNQDTFNSSEAKGEDGLLAQVRT